MSSHDPGIAYRPDIDGLRAISVTAVILFHAGVPGFQGGYVGVDIFFVISGYLITLLLIKPSAAGIRVRLAEFYWRRARRILPGLLCLLGVATLVAGFLYLPSDLQAYGESAILASLMLGNVGVWATAGGYFDPGERFVPLTHLWSIGVEEQFYLLFPLFLLLLQRYWPAARRRALVAITLLSFALCVWASYQKPHANYYMLPTRAWQLALGALVALRLLPPMKSRIAREALAIAAMGVILLSVLVYSRDLRYPGLFAVAPSMAAAVLLARDGDLGTLVARLLSLRAVVFVGLISYSLYLWHFPLFAFYDYFIVRDRTIVELLTLLGVLVALSIGSWALIEKPVRTRRALTSQRAFAFVTIGVTAIIVVAGGIFWKSHGLPGRLPAVVQQVAADAEQYPDVAAECFTLPLDAVAQGRLCHVGPEDASRTILVWGDSHAYSLLPEYARLAAEERVRIYFGIRSACIPLLESRAGAQTDPRRKGCRDFNAAMSAAIKKLQPDVVVLNAFWIERAGTLDYPFQNRSLTRADVEAGLAQADELARAGSSHVCAVLTVPEYQERVPYLVAMAYRRGDEALLPQLSKSEARRQLPIESVIRDFGARHKWIVSDPKGVLCPDDRCTIFSPSGQLLYRDAHHLVPLGAYFIAATLRECLRTTP